MGGSTGGELSQDLPPATPLLTRGDSRSASEVRERELGAGLTCTTARYTYEYSEGENGADVYRWSVALVGVPETIGFAPRVTCYDRHVKFEELDDRAEAFVGYVLGSGDDSSRLPDREVKLESEAIRKRYKLRVDHDLGENWVRQLFSPSFIAWLTDRAPRGFGFELVDGTLCAFAPEEVAKADAVAAAAAEVAARMRNEALEEAGLGDAGRAAQPDRPQESLDAATARAVATVRWTAPPPDAATAIAAYRGLAMRTWRPWVYGILSFLGSLALGLLLLFGGSSGSGDGDAVLGGILLTVGSPGIGYASWRKFVMDRATRYGKAAFALEYAKSRGLRPEQPRLAQARNMQLRFPGVVESAMSGVLPGDLEGTLALSATRARKKRRDFDVCITSLPGGFEVPENGEVGDGMNMVCHGEMIALWTQSAGQSARSARELDRFCERCGAALRRERQSS